MEVFRILCFEIFPAIRNTFFTNYTPRTLGTNLTDMSEREPRGGLPGGYSAAAGDRR